MVDIPTNNDIYDIGTIYILYEKSNIFKGVIRYIGN